MPIFVEGSQVLPVSFQPSNWSLLSVRLLDSLPVNSRTRPLLFTTVAGQHHPISFYLSFALSDINQTDIVLGHDWAAFLRDSLLSLGNRVDSSFDAWRFVSYTTHPILNAPRLPSVMSDEHDLMAIDQTSPNRAASYPGHSTATILAFPECTPAALPRHTLKTTLKSQIIRPTYTMHHWP
ncbi:hypothetical protein B0H13DRAFT_2312808 [Mycena leptocephala]|nr:hypothetical protein B0H13DRAFT_2312808 [Mycena leptocephala]